LLPPLSSPALEQSNQPPTRSPPSMC